MKSDVVVNCSPCNIDRPKRPASLKIALSRCRHEARAMDAQTVREQQQIADRFYALGLIPKAIAIRKAVWAF